MVNGGAHKPWYKVRKSDVMFITGLIFAVHEVFVSSVERPSLLIFIAGLLGFPVWVRYDQAKRANGKPRTEEQ